MDRQWGVKRPLHTAASRVRFQPSSSLPRLHALSDLHLDYEANRRWLDDLSRDDFRQDALLLAGDVSDRLDHVAACFEAVTSRFAQVVFVPGNHDLWVRQPGDPSDSMDKLEQLHALARRSGVHMGPVQHAVWRIVPLLGWYDHSFGAPSAKLRAVWMDYRCCRWPDAADDAGIDAHLQRRCASRAEPPQSDQATQRVVTMSHFMPRLDLLPSRVPSDFDYLHPVLGNTRLDTRLRALGSTLHVYGHSHINRHLVVDGVTYVNNALGYPSETRLSRRQLLCVAEA